MRLIFFLLILLFVQNVSAATRFSLNRVWPNLNRSAIVDDIDLKLRVAGKFQLLDNSSWCIIAGEIVQLKEKSLFLNGQWMVSGDFLDEMRKKGWLKTPKRLDPIKSGSLVIIDAGHGGKDSGAIGLSGLREKDVVLDIAKRVNLILLQKNVRVHMTRDKDVFVDLHKRCEISNKKNATVFVSIHCNSNNNRDIHGYQLYRMDPKISHSSRANWSRKKYNIKEHAPMDKNGKKKIFSSFESLFRWKDEESLDLCNRTNEFLKYRKTNITLLPKKNLCVLRETFAPSVLVETDFISNVGGEAKMTNPSWRERVANDIAKGILSYLGLGPRS